MALNEQNRRELTELAERESQTAPGANNEPEPAQGGTPGVARAASTPEADMVHYLAQVPCDNCQQPLGDRPGWIWPNGAVHVVCPGSTPQQSAPLPPGWSDTAGREFAAWCTRMSLGVVSDEQRIVDLRMAYFAGWAARGEHLTNG